MGMRVAIFHNFHYLRAMSYWGTEGKLQTIALWGFAAGNGQVREERIPPGVLRRKKEKILSKRRKDIKLSAITPSL